MSIAVLGVNHRTAPLEVRERFAHAAHEVPPALERVLRAGAGGGVLLSTCNRTEFYLAQPGGTVAEAVWELLSERLGGGGAAQEYGYVQRDRDAVRHLYRVSAGLDSMILGESQIQGQVREAWQVSRVQAGPGLPPVVPAGPLARAPVATADMVLCSTAAPHAVVPWERVAPAIRRRGGRPLCLLDLAVPRDVEPAVAQLENVFLYDIDDLQAVAAQATAQRRGEIPAAERIVSEEVDRFWGWYDGLGVVPVIRAFRDRLDDLRRAELERALRRLGHLSPEDRAQVDQFSQALLNKFLHEPTVVLKRAARVGHGYGLLEALKKLFGLETGAGR